MPKNTEFGGRKYKETMKTEIHIQIEIDSPLFSSCWFLRDANGGGRRGQNATPAEK
jgi:hypothetical protein